MFLRFLSCQDHKGLNLRFDRHLYPVVLSIHFVGAQSDFYFNTLPDIIQCTTVNITWNGGSPPFLLEVLPQEETSAVLVRGVDQSVTIDPVTSTQYYPFEHGFGWLEWPH